MRLIGLRLLVKLLGKGMRASLQNVHRLTDRTSVFSLDRVTNRRDLLLDAGDLVCRNAVSAFVHRLLDRVPEGVSLVAQVDHLTSSLVVCRMRFGILHHPVDIVLAEA